MKVMKPKKRVDVGEVYRTLFETSVGFRTPENFDVMANGLDKRLELIGISENLIVNIAGLARKFEVSNTTPYLIARNYSEDCACLDRDSFNSKILVRNKTLQGTYTRYFYPE